MLQISLQYDTNADCEPHCTDKERECTSTTTAGNPSGFKCCHKCFPASAKVHLQNGKIVTMSELGIGDAVKSGEYHIS